MNEWLRQFQRMEKPEQAIRAVVIGGTALLFLMAMVDVISGKHDQAVAPRVGTTTQVAASPDVADEPEVAEADTAEDAPEDMAAEETADAADEPEVAEASVSEDATEDMAADETAVVADEPAMATADTAEVATEDMAADETSDVADEPAMAEADTTEDATEDMAADETAVVADEPAMAEADTAEDATEDMAADETAVVADEPAMAEADTAEDATEAGEVSALLASANVEDGQRVFRQCAACHVYDAEQNRGGPHLVNIVGRDVGVADGWRYSRALSENGGVWTVESLLAWLENPDSYIPGNQMAFRGLRNEQDRIDVLGFLQANRAD